MKPLLSCWRKKLASAIVVGVAVVLPLTLSASNSKWSNDQAGAPSNVQPAAKLQRVLDSIVKIDNVSNAALFVEVGSPPASFQASSDSFSFQGSAGEVHRDPGVAMTPDHPFRIASITKTMTAVVALQLVEAGYVSLDTRLEEIFADSDMPTSYQVADLHVLDGIGRGGQITVHQLLNHTSGLEDYLSYKNDTDDGPDALALADALAGGASGAAFRQWSASELLAHYFQTGRGIVPAGMPGDTHYYSDTNYLLLGLMIEKLTGDSYANQLRTRIFEPLHMNRSYLEWHEPIYGDKPVNHHLDMGKPIGNLDVVSLAINTSFDWAGGGVVSTVSDLNTFARALINGDLFEQQATLSLMLAWVQDEGGIFYGLGLERFTLHGVAFIGHSGFWGANLYYLPELDT